MIALDANITKEGHANMKNTNENLEEEYSGPSKSELKRRAEHLQDLGKELTTLGAETLAKIELPEVILKAIEDYHRVPSFGAKTTPAPAYRQIHESIRRRRRSSGH